MLVASVVAILIYIVYRSRLRRLLELERVRTRIATDLHDDIGSSLSQIAILSEVVRQKVGGGAVDKPLNMIADTSREMVDSMSDIVWAINPEKDHLFDLVQRMRRFASDILEARGIELSFNADEAHRAISLGVDTRREIYFVFKECINNAAKHSDANRVDVHVTLEARQLLVKVSDNGKGIDPSRANGDGPGGNGLVSMRRRTEHLGGVFEVVTNLGRGVSITIRVPTKERRAPLPT